MKQRKEKLKKYLAMFLAVIMIVSMIPGTAFAEEVVADSTLAGLEIAVGGNTMETASVQTLTPVFDSKTTEYETPVLDYQGDKNLRYVLVKVDAPEGVTVTAKCGKSNVTTLVSGEWGVVEVQGGVFFSPTFEGPLEPGTYNKVIITVTKDGAEDKVYTVTIPMQPDISNKSLAWKTNLTDARYITKNSENVALTVEADYKNRPLENEDVITYQWYQNTTASTEDGKAIEGADKGKYNPKVDEVGTTYYYATASCNDLESITSNLIKITVTEDAAPKSVSVVCDHPYTIPNDWVKALGGAKYVAKIGDTLKLKAIDENGKETPVKWLASGGMYGGTIDQETGIYTITSTSYSYIQVASLYDETIKSEEKVLEVADYSINQSYKNPSITLKDDGQSFNKISTSGGLATYTLWDYKLSDENIAELLTDLSKKGNGLEFTAMRPGTIEASFELDLNGDGVGDGYGHTDSAVLTINGIAVEDAEGKLTKTYLEMGEANPASTMQLTALSSTENAAFTWSSADESVATVDENGLVTAKGVGSVIISANDGTYTGGIKVVVTSADTPYFEQIDFTTTTTWSNGLSNATWKTADFKPVTLEYTGLAMTKAAASTLTLSNTTLYNTEKYTAAASYTDASGEKQFVPINSGAVTELKNIPFDTSVIAITLTDKTDETKVTTYTFEITRPRDTVKTIANNGISFMPEGREIWKDKYDNKTEGIMYVANEDGSFAQYQGVNSSRKYYRTYAMNGLSAFNLSLKATSAYAHLRISTDDGTTWKYLGQSTASGISSGQVAIPTPTGEENSVVKVMVQILDDAAYTANVNAGKDGFADSTPDTYYVWVEQIPVIEEECDIVTAIVDHGDWYPEFNFERTNYRLIVDKDIDAPVLTFTVSKGVTVTLGEEILVSNENGEYTLELTTDNQTLLLTSESGLKTKSYVFGYSQKESDCGPDKVVDYLLINGQYVNGNAGGYGTTPQQTLTGGLLSLGNFGGYVTFYMDEGLTDHPNHAYGVDFYIDGNAFKDTSTGTGLGSMEPGQVWVSENGTTWYALAGSEHYESSTIWDYSVTYTKTATGGIDWSDNQGNTKESTHGRSFDWPKSDYYYLNDVAKQDSVTLSGILLPCYDGTITGTDVFGSYSKGARFGYVDTLVNGRNNPYLANDKYQNESSGFDLAWAVDTEGNPVDVSNKSFHYVKVVTASNIIAGLANEKSTEVGGLLRAVGKDSAVGVTAAPEGVTITSTTGGEKVDVTFEDGKQLYDVSIGDMEYVSVKVNGTTDDDNIYVNNIRVENGEAAEGIKVNGTQYVRIIVQNGEKEPVIYLLKLTSTASSEDDLLSKIMLNVGGANRVAGTKDGVTYTANVAYRIDEIQIQPKASDGASVTINGEEVKESYALAEGENIFEIVATKETEKGLFRTKEITQEVTLIVTRDKVPESTGEITVYFTLLGDSDHEDTEVHKLADGNLETWVPTTAYVVNSPAVVLDIFEKVMEEYGWNYKNSGNYISEVNGLAEFDNGRNSGWMYTLNGIHSDLGVAEQALEEGDVIVFHYTDDYTTEEYNTGEEVSIAFVEGLIEDIGTVTLDSETAIGAARAAYEKLTEQQQAQVSNYDDLLDAEAALKALKEELHKIEDIYTETGDSLEALAKENAPVVGTMGGEWMVIGLERSGRDVTDEYYDNVVAYVKENMNDKGQLHARKSTDNSRVILGLTAAGYDPTDVAGYNLLEGLTDMDYVTWQGNNGAMFALLAFDSHDYEIPTAPEGADQVTREKLVEEILRVQLDNGGWALSGTKSDVDMTGMAIQSLAPYYETNEEVKAALDKALAYLSDVQLDNGGFSSIDGICAESCAQVIVALTALGINPHTDERFVKNGTSVVEALCQFYAGEGSFKHVPGAGKDAMATEQSYYALTAYFRFLEGKTSLYDMSDVTINETQKPEDGEDQKPEGGEGQTPDDGEGNEGQKPEDGEDQKPDDEGQKPEGGEGNKTQTPDTGDDNNVILWIALMVLTVGAAVTVMRKKEEFHK